MTTKTPKKNAKKSNAPETVTETVEQVPKELTAGQIQLRNDLAQEFYEVEDYTTCTSEQRERIEKWASKMKAPKVKKDKPEKPPKRTAGRLIAPTMRVKDENNILQAMYGMKALKDGISYKGGWGSVDPSVDWNTLIDGLQSIIDERKIADDTAVVVPQ